MCDISKNLLIRILYITKYWIRRYRRYRKIKTYISADDSILSTIHITPTNNAFKVNIMQRYFVMGGLFHITLNNYASPNEILTIYIYLCNRVFRENTSIINVT